MTIGFHASIAGGISKAIDRAEELGCTVLQIFGRNPRTWKPAPLLPEEARRFRVRYKEAGITACAIHTSYLINLCSPEDDNFKKSIELFKGELEVAEAAGVDYLVTHMGSSKGEGDEYALKRITEALNIIDKDMPGLKTEILMENTAGGGSSYGSDIKAIGDVIKAAKGTSLKIGLCLDTCHAFAAGYPLKSKEDVDDLVAFIKKHVGIRRLKFIHLNDSKGDFGSRRDRHDHIGKGKIGMEGLGAFLSHPSLKGIPASLETPEDKDGDNISNLKTANKLRYG